jgi:hypothetical protein
MRQSGGHGTNLRGLVAIAHELTDFFKHRFAEDLCFGIGSNDKDIGRFGAPFGKFDRVREDGVLAVKIGLADPTGLRAAASYIDRNTLVSRARNKLFEGRKSDWHHHIHVLILNEHRGIARQVDLRVDPGLGRPVDGEVNRHAGLGRVVRSMGSDIDQLCHFTASSDDHRRSVNG